MLGHIMTSAYKRARVIIKKHVNADEDDVLLVCGSGMTGALNKFQSILGIKVHEQHRSQLLLHPNKDEMLPVVFITHYEHHSNQISWENAFVSEVVIVPSDAEGRVSVTNFTKAFQSFHHYKYKIACISACSNVTGVYTPYHEIAKIAHENGVLCFVDFSASFGYVDIDMHPTTTTTTTTGDDSSSSLEYLDAIFCSPHKLLGGPGACGICIFNKRMYQLTKPDFCGGGTVNWTNPWGEQGYVDSIEEREDAGTPPFLQTIRCALAIQLKEKMTVSKLQAREHHINQIVFDRLLGGGDCSNITILASQIKDRLSIFSIYIQGLHYNLLARLLNDYYGIQCRGGCNCAGTYGHILFNIDTEESHAITDRINQGDFSTKPGWCRISFHPIMTDKEVHYICDSVLHIAKTFKELSEGYIYDPVSNQFSLSSAGEDNKLIETMVDQIMTVL
jgi:selenocysteine lyase/cysteine desulfurase